MVCRACWGLKQKTEKFLQTFSPWSILCSYKITEQRWCSYLWRSRAGNTFPHKSCRWRQPKLTSRSCSQTGQWRWAPLSVVPPRDYTHTVYRHPLGSGPANQRKKDSDQKSSSAIASGLRSFPSRAWLQTWEQS
jgi:hypothetical protein